MKELNLGRILTEHRHKRGITQEELAEFMGVSKASVSKWENSATYPDITLLPRLATFFHISIDELMGYQPQMSPRDIRALYRQLAHDFTVRPLEEALTRCREISQKYFACPPLLFQIGSLYLNHCGQAQTPKLRLTLLEEAMGLFCRTRQESEDVALKSQALHLEAFCLLQLERGQEALALLDTSSPLRMAPEPLLSTALKLTGQPQKAVQVLQAGIYQAVLELINLLLPYLQMCHQDPVALEETCRRTLALAEAFRLKTLHPGFLLTIYASIAQAYAAGGETGKALDMLELYGDLALSDIYPLRLHGDSYFTMLDDWMEENLPLGADLPRDDGAIQRSIQQELLQSPAFAGLTAEKRFQALLRRFASHTASDGHKTKENAT